ncbi:MAG: hypothetical protein AB7P04_10980 [Bacteriovoracia bacterium]
MKCLSPLHYWFFLVGGISLGGLNYAHARLDYIPGSRYTSARAAALGDAFIPLAEDGASALFYNPAMIAGLRKPHFEPLNFQLQANTDLMRMLRLDFYKAMSLSGYLPNLQGNEDKFPGFGYALFPNFFLKGISFGVLYQGQVAGQVTGSNVRYRSKYQLIPTFGFGVPLAHGIVKLGYSLQWVNQASGDLTVPVSNDPLGYNQGLAQGTGISHNLGFTITFPVRLLPTFSLVARNLGGLHWYSNSTLLGLSKNPAGALEDEAMSLDAAFSFRANMGKGSYSNIALQLRDALGSSGASMIRRLAAGWEMVFGSFRVRLGVNSLYPSAGLGFSRETADFGLTWHSEDIGTAAAPNRDVRFILHYQIRAF